MGKINRTQLEIEKLLLEPFKVGEVVSVDERLVGNRGSSKTSAKIIEIDGDEVVLEAFGGYKDKKTYKVHISNLGKSIYYVGYSPMVRPSYRLETINFSLESIVFDCGFDRRERKFKPDENIGEITVPELNWNPYVIQSDGSKFYYQREFVWTLEDKQSFIDSIYNNISLGKVILRERGFEWNRQQALLGNTVFGYKDIVDGKQRLNCILSFLQDEFPDSKGFYYSEFSKASQNQFLNHQLLGYAKLDENASDKDVIDCFLRTNFSGVQMSKEHLEYIKTIKL